MYLPFFKLHSRPFDISPDPSFMWLGEKHREGLATLKYGLLQNKGLLMITGDVGTGKTALIQAIEKEIEAHIMLITIPDPSLSLLEFYNVIANELGMNRTFETKGAFLIEFKRLVLKAAAAHRYVLMIIDEAHRLTSELLEEIRLLSNIDLDGQVLVSTFLVGQLELKELISRTENRAVRQRISVAYELLPLTFEETEQYISHRLHVSGSKSPIFTPEAIGVVHARSFGYPRLINIICDHALVTGFVSGVKTIGPEIIEECCNELRITLGPNLTEEKRPVPAAGKFRETAPPAPPFSAHPPVPAGTPGGLPESCPPLRRFSRWGGFTRRTLSEARLPILWEQRAHRRGNK